MPIKFNPHDGLPPPDSQYLEMLKKIGDAIAEVFGGMIDEIPDHRIQGVPPKDQKFINALRRIKQAFETATGGIVTIVHNNTTGRDAPDAHPIDAISELRATLDGLQEQLDYLMPDMLATETGDMLAAEDGNPIFCG
jgi:hypothetical protein